ncbi:hypothetical protein [Halostella sp. PRR32]|nr:hypothetical protein [Halostella sp. PRR32]
MTENTHSDDQRPVSFARRWLRVAKLLLTVIVLLIGILESLGLL